jgi:hypothetical protein
MPTLVSDGIKNGKQKGPGTDASMITAMRRNRAVLNGLTSEKFADGVSFAVSATTGDLTTMTYTYTSNTNTAPFNPGDIVTVTGHSPSITVGTGAGTLSVTTIASSSGNITVGAVTDGAPTITLANPATGLLQGMVITFTGTGLATRGLSASDFYIVNTLASASSFTILKLAGATNYSGSGTETVLTTTAGTVTGGTVTTTATIATITYGDTTSNAFTVGDRITINNHSVVPNGTYRVFAISGTTVRVQVASAISGTATTTTATITPVSSAFNGTFSLLSCTTTSFTIAGPGVLSSTATVSGITKLRTKPIVDSINSRGYLVSGVLPVLTARGMNLSFFPVS